MILKPIMLPPVQMKWFTNTVCGYKRIVNETNRLLKTVKCNLLYLSFVFKPVLLYRVALFHLFYFVNCTSYIFTMFTVEIQFL